MKNYTVKINTETRLFCQSDFQKIGSCLAKNKEEAIEKVYAAFWGADNDAFIYVDMAGFVTPSSKSRMKAFID